MRGEERTASEEGRPWNIEHNREIWVGAQRRCQQGRKDVSALCGHTPTPWPADMSAGQNK